MGNEARPYVGKDSSGGWYSSVTSSGGNSSGGVISSVSGSFGNSWLHKSDAAEVLAVAVVFFFVFGVPCLVLFLIFYLSYRNRRAKYRLAELALEKGQPLPPGMFEKEGRDLRAKGISNVCLGLGLLILLSVLVGAGLGCVGLMVMLAGVVVNSGIYVINEYRLFMRSPQTAKRGAVRVYVKAYNHKIIPVMLTVFSTVLGLVPFFIYCETEPFLNSIATGVTGGLLFSVPALVLVLPVMLGKGKPERMHYDCQEV